MKNSKFLNTLLFSFIWLWAISSLYAQNTYNLTLDSCYHWAQENYPLTGQFDLLEQTNNLHLENLSTKNLPQLQLTGQATYQSAVTEIPLMVPGFDIPTVGKDQYKLYGEVIQPLNQFKTVQQETDLAKINHEIRKQKLTISLRELKNRINTLYFGIILLKNQIEQSRITSLDIGGGIKRLDTAVKFGTALPSDVDLLKAEMLQLDQQIYILESRKNQFFRMLSVLTGHGINPSSIFQKPSTPDLPDGLHRPELELYTLEQVQIDQQRELYHQQIQPQLNLFLQGGYGKPALNFLDNDFKAFFIGGVRLQWNLSSYYTRQRKDQIWAVQKRSIEMKSQTFRLNTHIQKEKFNEEIQRFQNLLQSDQDIISFRNSIKIAAENQLSQGTITPMDYLSVVHEEEKARQSKTFHEVLLLQAQYNWQYENGN